MFEKLKQKGFQILALHHAEAILTHDMPEAEAQLESVLLDLEIPAEELVRGGGGEGEMTQRLRRALSHIHGWTKHNFEIKKIVDGIEKESISHEIDHVKQFKAGTFALEIEWNNKDPFYDRDLENFKRLHADGAISAGIIVTRGRGLQEALRGYVRGFVDWHGIDSIEQLARWGYLPTARQRREIERRATRTQDFRAAFADMFTQDKFGEATTHWRKLEDRVHRGVGNPCPLLLIGLPADIVRPPEGEEGTPPGT